MIQPLRRIHGRMFLSLGIVLPILRDASGSTVEISSSANLLVPDVLVYASTSESKRDVPADAVLLGAFVSGKTYRLPSANSRFVLLYSLARRELLGVFPAGAAR